MRMKSLLHLAFIKDIIEIPTEKIQSDLVDIKVPSPSRKDRHEVRNGIYLYDAVGRELF